jgi:sigma-54 dependent transcriptional regulator, acetoin dehydrogenase operon transcriptional activator AcoR
MTAPPVPLPTTPDHRLARIEAARRAVMNDEPLTAPAMEPWIERSWRRCLASGQRPEQRVGFDVVSSHVLRRTLESNRNLIDAARPVLQTLGRAIANTRYFAILTNASGVVVDVNGPIDRSDRRASMITRVGVDLSEASVGTTAIGAALVELQPVWLHRGEHFFADTSVYSCAGAPLFGPDGLCVGMLDLTGIEAVERPELRHMVVQSARSIENALTLRQPHSLLVRLNWPGGAMGEDSDGMICLDGDGWVTGANPTARQMVSQLGVSGRERVHASELFALPFEMLFDASEQANYAMELPLWSGLRLQARAQRPGHPIAGAPAHDRIPLKEVEIALIHKAVADAKGNVQQAARALGISRATVYRKLGRRPPMA